MSNCNIMFNKGCDGQYMSRPVEDVCTACSSGCPPEDACICPPLGEPKVNRGRYILWQKIESINITNNIDKNKQLVYNYNTTRQDI